MASRKKLVLQTSTQSDKLDRSIKHAARKKRSQSEEHQKPEVKYTVPGVVLTCGQGDVGQLGLTDQVFEKKRFTHVDKMLEPVVQVAAGGMHTVCLTSNGEVWTFGCNDEGALGRKSSDEDTFVPGKVTIDGKVIQVSAGDSHTAALTEDGRAFIWGSFRDTHGAMRNSKETLDDYMFPRLVDVPGPIVRLASGGEHILLLTSTGEVFTAGCPEQGQLGRLSKRSATRDTRFGFSILLKPDAIRIRGCKFFVDVWATQYGSFVRDREMGIYAFGLNNYGQLGLKVTDQPVMHPVQSISLSDAQYKWVKVTGGDHHTICLDDSGKVYCLGRKEYGRLGLGQNSDDATEPTLISSLSDKKIVDIGCGSAVSYAVAENGDAFAWGFGSNGQLGCGEDDDDSWLPQLIKSKNLKDNSRRILLVDGGGQHGVLLASNDQST